MNLVEEVKAKAEEFRTDSYLMSVGEILSLYQDGELILSPYLQNRSTWTIEQKSRFIEIILLGFPLASICVYQREEDGVWEIMDGYKRISTILEFVGELKDENGKTKPYLVLKGTKLLPNLEGFQWENAENEEHNLPTPLRIEFKRGKMQVQIFQNDLDPKAKFTLFDHLNMI
jgi:uncharacterized protein with ParB-like and HNH nuclease domain